ncbi:hypothetical protein EDB89DRAFT_2239019 [Lactarius sanguifluus]|nr:hypothetical protein EDB89DRAFT_2239019 [Lactarius sanguifluus]
MYSKGRNYVVVALGQTADARVEKASTKSLDLWVSWWVAPGNCLRALVEGGLERGDSRCTELSPCELEGGGDPAGGTEGPSPERSRWREPSTGLNTNENSSYSRQVGRKRDSERWHRGKKWWNAVTIKNQDETVTRQTVMPVNKGGSGCGDLPPDYEGPGTHLQGKYGWQRTMSDVERLTSGGKWREQVMIDGDGRCDGVRRRIQGRIHNGSGVAEIVERERTPNFGAVKRRDVTQTHTNPLICLYLHCGCTG